MSGPLRWLEREIERRTGCVDVTVTETDDPGLYRAVGTYPAGIKTVSVRLCALDPDTAEPHDVDLDVPAKDGGDA